MTEVTLQPCTKDAHIDDVYPLRNYGVQTYFYIGEFSISADTIRTLMQFDFSAIPANATVISATLSIYLFQDVATEGDTYRVYRLLKEWDEGNGLGGASHTGDVTWNNRKTGVAWTASGGFDAADCEQNDIGSLVVGAAEPLNNWLDFTLTPAKVEDWIDGTLTNNGMLFKSDNENNDAYGFRSSQYGADPSLQPKLFIEYTEGLASAEFGPKWQVG